MRLEQLVLTSRDVQGTRARRQKVEHLSELLRQLGPEEIGPAVAYLSGELPQGRIGLGYAAARAAAEVPAAAAASLSLVDVDAELGRIANLSGPGSTTERKRRFGQLLARATAAEKDFLLRLVVGELRQGALEGLMVEAVARAAQLDAAAVRRAQMLAADMGAVARAALTGGAAALSQFSIQLFRPLQPMLAQPADDVDAALASLGEAAFEYKLDGARIQVHKAGDLVRVYTRGLNEVTAAVPEVVQVARALPARELILDGEAIALRSDHTPHPFQVTMRRFGRKNESEQLRASLPLTPFFFDLLYLDGDSLLDRPTRERAQALAAAVPDHRMPSLVTADAGAARAFLDEALRRGHEGAMAKSLAAPYEAGSRGAGWLKLKPTHTLDLVILAAEWGSGRRRGWLSNLHLGARDPDTGSYVMLGKTFKGLTDAMLAWQTEKLLSLELGRDGHIVYVRPELVAEIAFNDVQTSPHYPGGMALRFARVKRYREDKRPEDADTIATVRALHTAATR